MNLSETNLQNYLASVYPFEKDPDDSNKLYCPFCEQGIYKERSHKQILTHITHPKNPKCNQRWSDLKKRFRVEGMSCIPNRHPTTVPPAIPPQTSPSRHAVAAAPPEDDDDGDEDGWPGMDDADADRSYHSDDDDYDADSSDADSTAANQRSRHRRTTTQCRFFHEHPLRDDPDFIPPSTSDDEQDEEEGEDPPLCFRPKGDHSDGSDYDDAEGVMDHTNQIFNVDGASTTAPHQKGQEESSPIPAFAEVAAMSTMDPASLGLLEEDPDDVCPSPHPHTPSPAGSPHRGFPFSPGPGPSQPVGGGSAPSTPVAASDNIFVPEEGLDALKDKLRTRAARLQDRVNFEPWDEYQAKKKGDDLYAPWPKEDVHLLLLLKMLNTAKAPLCLFDKITEWARSACLDNAFSPWKAPTRRKKFVERIRARQGVDVQPISTPIVLPFSKLHLNMITFDFQKQVSSLLQDRVLTQWKKLRWYDPTNPYAGPPQQSLPFPDEHQFVDLLSGRIATLAFTIVIRMWPEREGTDVPVMVTFFMDGTHIDTQGRHTLCPLRFTLSLFKSEVRSKNSRPHRILAYIPSLDKLKAEFPGKNEDERNAHKNADYQYMLSHALKSYLEAELKGGIYWEFQRPVTVPGQPPRLVPTPFVLQLYYGMLKGDIQGHNWACAHKHGHGPKQKAPCRQCTIPGNKLHDWDYPFQPIPKEEIRTKAGAQRYDYHWCEGMKVAFDQIKTTGLNEFKVNKARERELKLFLDTAQYRILQLLRKGDHIGARTIGDILHAIMKGLLYYGVQGFRRMYRNDLKGKAKKKILSGGTRRPMAEKALHYWGILLQNQSCRDLPRTNFTVGALSTEKLNAHEYPGLIILYLLLTCSTLGDHWFSDFDAKFKEEAYTRMGYLGNARWKKWVLTLDNLCLVVKFLKSDSITKREVDMYRRFIPIYLDDYALALDRQDGNKMDILKIHSGLHIPDNIENLGPAVEWDTNVDEWLHISMGKSSAVRTQKRKIVFEYQCGKQYSDDTAVDSAYDELEHYMACCSRKRRKLTHYPRCKGRAFLLREDHGFCLLREGRKLRSVYADDVSFDDSDDGSTSSLDSFLSGQPPVPLVAKWHDAALQNSIQKFFKKSVFPHCKHQRFLVRNSYHPNSEQIYRAQPGKPTQAGYKGGWNDWAFVKYGGNEVPAHLLCFVEITGVTEAFTHRGTKVGVGGGTYAVCHLVTKIKPSPIKGLVEQCSLVKRATKDHTAKHPTFAPQCLTLYLIPVADIVGPCICVPDIKPVAKGRDFIGSRTVELDKVEFLMLELPKEWKRLLVKRMTKNKCDREPTAQEKTRRRDNREEPSPLDYLDGSGEEEENLSDDYEDDEEGQAKKAQREAEKKKAKAAKEAQKKNKAKVPQNKKKGQSAQDDSSDDSDDDGGPKPGASNKKKQKPKKKAPSKKTKTKNDSSDDSS